MKHQYVGDINDYRKYALLRSLAANGGNRIGVCWMLIPSDGGPNGNKLTYLEKPKQYRHFDPPLFDILAHATAEPERRRLQTIENSGAIPKAVYHNTMLPQAVGERAAYMAECRAKFADADLVFFDPDNGIEAPKAKLGRKAALKYVFLDELAAFYGNGKSVLVYQQFPIKQHRKPFLVATLERLRVMAPDAAIWTFTTSFVVFFLLIHPESPARLAIAAEEACGHWSPDFINGECLSPALLAAG